MDSPACLACGERAITWDSEANHAVCTSCGNADTNPMLVVGQFVRPQDTLLHRPYISNNFPDNPYINQNLLQGAEWHLQNHLKEHRVLISNLCQSLNFSGHERAIYLFELAMAKGDYRWGNEATLVSGVAIAIAMVEKKKADAVARIAELVQEPLRQVLRMWTRVVRTLDIQLHPTSPLLFVEVIRAYLQEETESGSLPYLVKNILSPRFVPLDSVSAVAEQIALFFSHTKEFERLPAASTACAIFILAIESITGQALPVPGATSLAQCLGDRMGPTAHTILDRRRAMVLMFNEWAVLLPWVTIPTGVLWNQPRISAVVRAIPDVLQFQTELKGVRGAKGDIDHRMMIDDDSNAAIDRAEEVVPHSLESPTHQWTRLRSRKRPPGAQRAQRIIAQLLDPRSDETSLFDSSADVEAVQERLSRIELQVLFDAQEPLTRLEALCLGRGGEAHVDDEELFEPGELEGYLNSEETAHSLEESHPEWNIQAPSDSIVQGKRSKADAIPRELRYSDEEDATFAAEGQSDSESEGKIAPEREEKYVLGKGDYMAFGILADYEGTDPDTIRYFGSNMEQAT